MMECRMVNSPDLNCSWCCRLIISVRIRYLCGNQCQLLRSLLLRWPSLAAGRPRALGCMFEATVSHLVCLWLCWPVNAPLSRSRLDLSVCCCVYRLNLIPAESPPSAAQTVARPSVCGAFIVCIIVFLLLCVLVAFFHSHTLYLWAQPVPVRCLTGSQTSSCDATVLSAAGVRLSSRRPHGCRC